MECFDIANGQNANMLIDETSPKTIEESKQLVQNAILHACDISTSLREFDVSAQWADLLFDEFFNQGDTEKSMGLEVSMLCDRETTKVASGQAGFIQFVVMPIFQQLAQASPGINDVQLANGFENIEKWRVRAEAERIQEEKEAKMKLILQTAHSKKASNEGLDSKKLKENEEKPSKKQDENTETISNI